MSEKKSCGALGRIETSFFLGTLLLSGGMARAQDATDPAYQSLKGKRSCTSRSR